MSRRSERGSTRVGGYLAAATEPFGARLAAAGFDRDCQPPELDPGHVFGPDAYVVTGGCRIANFNATVPLAVLTCDAEWVQIRTRRMFGDRTPRQLGPPPVWIPRADFTHVNELSGRMTSGVLLRTRSGAFDGVIFWHRRPDEVRAAMERHGWSSQALD